MKKRVEEYDVIRVFLTLCVVFGHSQYLQWGGDNGFISCVSEAIHPINNGLFVRELAFLQSWVYRFHMPLFFVLSGACYALSSGGGYVHIMNLIPW